MWGGEIRKAYDGAVDDEAGLWQRIDLLTNRPMIPKQISGSLLRFELALPVLHDN